MMRTRWRMGGQSSSRTPAAAGSLPHSPLFRSARALLMMTQSSQMRWEEGLAGTLLRTALEQGAMLGLLPLELRIRQEEREAGVTRFQACMREWTPATPTSVVGRATRPATAPGGLLSGTAQGVAALPGTAMLRWSLRHLPLLPPPTALSAEACAPLRSDAAARPTHKASATVITGAGRAVAAGATRRQRSATPGGSDAAQASATPTTRGPTEATCSSNSGAGRVTGGGATLPATAGSVAATMSARGGGGGRAATPASGTRAAAGIIMTAVATGATHPTAAIRRRRCGDPARRAGPERRRRSLRPRCSRSSHPLPLRFRIRSPSSPC